MSTFPRMHEQQVDSDEALVVRLLRAQMPTLADRPVRRIPTDGTDNAVYRLGDDLAVRLPLIEWAVPQIDKEVAWLPRLRVHLPLAVPEPVEVGAPGEGYPWPWAVYGWIPGRNPLAADAPPLDLLQAADDLGQFVATLHALELPGLPRSGRGHAAPGGR